MLSVDPVFHEFRWRGVAERGMSTSVVVEQLDIVEQIGLRFGPRTVAGAMHPLILQAVEETLGRRVVPAVTSGLRRVDLFWMERLESEKKPAGSKNSRNRRRLQNSGASRLRYG